MRISAIALVLPALSLLGCSDRTADPAMLSGLELGAAEVDAREFLGEEFELRALCGGSQGMGFYLDEAEKGFSSDDIEEGVIAFGIADDGRLSVVHRDALKSMVAVREYDAVITKDGSQSDRPEGIWTIRFIGSGIVETHNLTSDVHGQAYNLWTSNKPAGLIQGRAMVFVSKCEFY